MMPYITDHKQKFDDLDFYLNNQDQIKIKANGGNSILFSYEPGQEQLYIAKAKELYKEKAQFVDISKLLVKFIDGLGWEQFENYYNDFRDTPRIVFKSDDPTENDLFEMIIDEIVSASNSERTPFLIRTGCLYGTGIENINIMEHPLVMKLKTPIVIFYPSKIENENLLFLNFKPASKYRCILVN